jgi:CheY-like chemotaxis protein
MSNSLLTTRQPIDGARRELSRAPTKRLVLVVDDHADTRDLLKFVVESLGHRAIEATDGEEAVRLVAGIMPDLILMDTNLPGIDGLMATKRIRELKSATKVTIIFLSGHAQPQSRDRALAAGGDDYFVKPINLSELELALAKILNPQPATC